MSNIHHQVLPLGTQLGVYEIKEISKIDSFEISYRAWNHHLKEWVGMREYFPFDLAVRGIDGLSVEAKTADDKGNFEFGLKAFLEQGDILTQIEHPNIVKAENILQFNKTAYLIFDAQEGMPLAKLAAAPSTFAETEIKFILVSVLSALQKVHEFNTVHGNIQPDSLFLSDNGEPLLTDFAAARLALTAKTAKQTGEFTNGYLPPELSKQSGQAAGPASDFYALGATLYHCITHNQPASSQSRLKALGQGLVDPVALLSGSQHDGYSPELLQTIDWMLRLDYNERPQSAIAILARLKSEPANDQAGSIAAKPSPAGDTNVKAAAISPVAILAMAAIAVLVIAGIWFGAKSPVTSEEVPSVGNSQPLAQNAPETNTITPGTKTDQPAAQSPDKAETGKIVTSIQQSMNEPAQQTMETEAKVKPTANSDENRLDNPKPAEAQALSTDKLNGKEEIKDKTIGEKASDNVQKLVSNEQSPKRKRPVKSLDKAAQQGSVKAYLAAAKKAMKDVRLTTPADDNAFKYYQMVLAIEPKNPIALAGLQKIVDRYAWFIRKSRSEGNLDTAKRALHKAESVLPNSPKLKRIRAEMTADN